RHGSSTMHRRASTASAARPAPSPAPRSILSRTIRAVAAALPSPGPPGRRIHAAGDVSVRRKPRSGPRPRATDSLRNAALGSFRTTQPSGEHDMRIGIAVTALLAVGGVAFAQHLQHQHQSSQAPYAGLQHRAVKALSDQQLADLRAGRGMGLALAAELNGYPGPIH